MKLTKKLRQAKDEKCSDCGKSAVVFFPVFDPDIPSYPYCRKCVNTRKIELLIAMDKSDKKGEQ
ncbi:MAG: hypothetical protein ACTSQF_00255 [Candidatus Heimdallarchaeaceae archaeon]